MLPVKLKLKRKGMTGRELTRTFREVNAAGMEAMGQEFQRVNLPRRFTYAGGKMLGYAPRNPRYNQRKKRELGHVDPLVFSGTSRALATRIRNIQVTSQNKRTRVRVKFGRARGLNRRNPNSNIRMNEEVTRMANKEHGPLLRVCRRTIRAKLARVNRK